MGWQNSDAPGHEGYLVGLVRDERAVDGWRRLAAATDPSAVESVEAFAVVCECGWRSPRFRAPLGTRWSPSWLEMPAFHEKAIEDAAGELWAQHWRLPAELVSRASPAVPSPAAPVVALAGRAERGGRLSLVQEVGGLRHVLLGRPVHAGDALELMVADGRWVSGRYENERGSDYLRATFYFSVRAVALPPEWVGAVAPAMSDLEASLTLPGTACLRWPPA